MKSAVIVNRCGWCTQAPEYIYYHDNEWGFPIHDDQQLFELLTLEGAQAGLSWLTILKKRDNYRWAFSDFNIQVVSRYNEKKIHELLKNPGIVRNKLKIMSTVRNAKAILEIQKKYDSFDDYLWSWVNNKPLKLNSNSSDRTEVKKVASLLSKDLRNYGMNFVGPTICYAFMQANGMISDHSTECFRNSE